MFWDKSASLLNFALFPTLLLCLVFQENIFSSSFNSGLSTSSIMGIQGGKGGEIGFRRKYFLFLILPHILQKPLLSHDLGPTELSSPMAWLSDSGYPTASFFFFNHWVFPAAYCCYLNFFKLPDWILSLSSLAHLIYLNLPVLDYLYF